MEKEKSGKLYPSTNIEHEEEYDNETSKSIFEHGASYILSTFYGILLVNLAIVFTASHYITSVGSLDIADYYLNALFTVSILWLISFGISVRWGCNRADAKQPIKSHQASNRWLKGVVSMFGFSIAIKDALELIALTEITNPDCEHKALYFIMPILHTPYIFGQVAFLFLYAKHHIQECQHLARFGIMHIMATNLSVWIATVAKEASEALAFEDSEHEDFILESPNSTKPTSFRKFLEISRSEQKYPAKDYAQVSGLSQTSNVVDGLFHGNCTCVTEYCTKVIKADKFLYPFLIEFCLISTCLLYVSWRKVGKKAKHHISIIRPSYQFYKAYKGPTVGALVLAATVTMIIVLGAFDSRASKKSYFTEYNHLHLYEGFLIICELSNVLACLLGFYLYKLSKKQKRKATGISLDIVLLFVCFIGPLLIGLFSILSLCVGDPDSKAPNWWISLLYPVADIISTVVQIAFIIYGMQHIPTTSGFRFTKQEQISKKECLANERNQLQRLILQEREPVIEHGEPLSNHVPPVLLDQSCSYQDVITNENPDI